MKNSYVWVIAMALLTASGCAKNQNSDEMDLSSEDPASADTAAVDDGGAPESEVQAAADPSLSPEPDTSSVTAQQPTPESPPAPVEPESVAPVAVYGSGIVDGYVVQKGDTLMKIAFNLYGDIDAWKQIYQMNQEQLKNASQLRAGMQLKYDKPATAPILSQNGEPYLIQKGDTLGRISNEVYATTRKWRKIWENNRQLIKDPNRIFAGFYLYYQITEQEKQMAEQHRATRSAASVGGVQAAPAASASAPTPTLVDAAPAAEIGAPASALPPATP